MAKKRVYFNKKESGIFIAFFTIVTLYTNISTPLSNRSAHSQMYCKYDWRTNIGIANIGAFEKLLRQEAFPKCTQPAVHLCTANSGYIIAGTVNCCDCFELLTAAEIIRSN